MHNPVEVRGLTEKKCSYHKMIFRPDATTGTQLTASPQKANLKQASKLIHHWLPTAPIQLAKQNQGSSEVTEGRVPYQSDGAPKYTVLTFWRTIAVDLHI